MDSINVTNLLQNYLTFNSLLIKLVVHLYIESDKAYDIKNLNMNKQEKTMQVKKQLNGMIEEIKDSLYKNIELALNSGVVPSEFLEDNYYLSKAIIDSFCQSRPYSALDKSMQKQFDKIHIYTRN